MAVTPFKSSDNFNMAGFNEKITEADNTYVAKTGGSMSGALSMGNNKITGLATPTDDGDAVNKDYVDNSFSNPLLGATFIGTLTNTTAISVNFDTNNIFQFIFKINGVIDVSSSSGYYIEFYNVSDKKIGIFYIFEGGASRKYTANNKFLILNPVMISTTMYYTTGSAAGRSSFLNMDTTVVSIKANVYSLTGTIDIYVKYF